MIADNLQISIQQGRDYRQQYPESNLREAQDEARRRWPEEPHIGLCRAFFLSGWAQAGFEILTAEASEP